MCKRYKISFLVVFSLAMWLPALASANYNSNFGFNFGTKTATSVITPDSWHNFTGAGVMTFVVNDIFYGTKMIAVLLKGVVGNAVQKGVGNWHAGDYGMTGYATSTANCSSSCFDGAVQGDDYFVVFYSEAIPISQWTSVGYPVNQQYGLVAFKWGTETPPDYTTRFISFNSPTDNQIVASTSVDFSVSYYYNDSTDDFSYFDIEIQDLSQNYTFSSTLNHPILTGQNTKEYNFILEPNVYYHWRAVMSSATTSQYFPSDYHDFYTLSNPLLAQIGASTTALLWQIATSTCSITNLTGCFQNALIYAFVPSQDSFTNLINLKNQVITKAPFGYFALVKDAMNTLSASATPSFTLATSSAIVQNIFNPLKTGISAVLWIAWGVWLIKTFSLFAI